MPWTTDLEIKKAVKSVLGADPTGPLASHWDELIARANPRGYRHVRAALIGRGYTASQLDAWESRTDWNRTAALYFAFHDAALNDETMLPHVEHLWEQLKDLATLTTLVGDDGLILTPPAGRVGHGSYRTADDLHTMEDEL